MEACTADLTTSAFSGVRRISLDIDLGSSATVVTAELEIERNRELPGEPLFLDGEDLELFRLFVKLSDDRVLELKVKGNIERWLRFLSQSTPVCRIPGMIPFPFCALSRRDADVT